MKFKSVLCAFLMMLTITPISAKRSVHVLGDDFSRRGKSLITNNFSCEAFVEDNNKQLSITFHKDLGKVNFIVSNSTTGAILHTSSTDAENGSVYDIYFNQELESGDYTIVITNGPQSFIGIFNID